MIIIGLGCSLKSVVDKSSSAVVEVTYILFLENASFPSQLGEIKVLVYYFKLSDDSYVRVFEHSYCSQFNDLSLVAFEKDCFKIENNENIINFAVNDMTVGIIRYDGCNLLERPVSISEFDKLKFTKLFKNAWLDYLSSL